MNPPRFALKRAHLWAIVPLALIWLFGSRASIEPFDFWWNVTSGRIMLAPGPFAFLGSDVLVYTPVREPYSNPQWGSQLLFYVLYSLAPLLLLTARVAIITATYGLLWAIVRRAGGSPAWAAAATLIAYLGGFTNYGMRPQLFAFLPFIGFLWVLERAFGGGYGHPTADLATPPLVAPRLLWLLPLLMLVWVNVHGSFFLGLILITAYALGAMLPRLRTPAGRQQLVSRQAAGVALPLLLTAAATLLNPYTWQIYSYVLVATGDATARALNIEWQPPTLYNGTGILFFAGAAIWALLLLASRRPLRLTETLLLLAFGGLALLSIRNVIWWGWVTAPGLALSGAALARRLFPPDPAPDPATDEAAPLPAREIPLLNWLLAGLLIGAALVSTPLWRGVGATGATAARNPALDPTTPSAVARFLAEGAPGHPAPPGPIFNYMEWGGYLEWVLYPRQQLFIDGRFEARQPQVWTDYLAISRGAATWQTRLDSYHVQTLVLNKTFHADLIPLVAASPAWQAVYDDPQAQVFTRRQR